MIPYSGQSEVKNEFINPFWGDLYDRHYVQTQSLAVVQNSLLFKYSSFHQLSTNQADIIQAILMDHEHHFLVNGVAGAGKTAMLTNLAANLCQKYPNKSVAVIVKLNWRETAHMIFKTYGDDGIDVYTSVSFINSKKTL